MNMNMPQYHKVVQVKLSTLHFDIDIVLWRPGIVWSLLNSGN